MYSFIKIFALSLELRQLKNLYQTYGHTFSKKCQITFRKSQDVIIHPKGKSKFFMIPIIFYPAYKKIKEKNKFQHHIERKIDK